MTKAPLKLTTQKVSAVLRKAGFRASKSLPSRVRGWHSRSTGYVTIPGSGWIGVSTTGYTDDVAARVLDKCRDNLISAGFSVNLAVDTGKMLYVQLPKQETPS